MTNASGPMSIAHQMSVSDNAVKTQEINSLRLARRALPDDLKPPRRREQMNLGFRVSCLRPLSI